MLDLSKIPEYQRSDEATILYMLRQTAAVKVSVPEVLRKKIDEALGTFFSDASEQIDDARKFYRARIHDFGQCSPFARNEMRGRQDKEAPIGRTQPSGQAVLYTAREAETAIAEVRPHCGSKVTIAEFSVKPGCTLRILNLTKYVKPVADKGPEDFMRSVFDLGKSMRFSEREFSRLVHADDPSKYLDTIYITQVVREQGFDGIAYRSLLNKGGLNYAFFNPRSLACVADPVVWEVKSVEYTAEQVKSSHTDSSVPEDSTP